MDVILVLITHFIWNFPYYYQPLLIFDLKLAYNLYHRKKAKNFYQQFFFVVLIKF